MSDEVDIELDGEESEDDEVSSVKKVKPVKAPLDKPKELTEEFEDLAVSFVRFGLNHSFSSNNDINEHTLS